MRADLLTLLNELRKRDKMRGMQSILSCFFSTRLIFNFKYTRTLMLGSIYHTLGIA